MLIVPNTAYFDSIEIYLNLVLVSIKSFTPLHVAAREGHVECMMLLLKNKFPVNAVNEGNQEMTLNDLL